MDSWATCIYGFLCCAYSCYTVATPFCRFINTCKICVRGTHFMKVIHHSHFFYAANLEKIRKDMGLVKLQCVVWQLKQCGCT